MAGGDVGVSIIVEAGRIGSRTRGAGKRGPLEMGREGPRASEFKGCDCWDWMYGLTNAADSVRALEPRALSGGNVNFPEA